MAQYLRTFANGHGRDNAFDCILALVPVFAIEIDTELVVFALSWASYAHDRGGRGGGRVCDG